MMTWTPSGLSKNRAYFLPKPITVVSGGVEYRAFTLKQMIALLQLDKEHVTAKNTKDHPGHKAAVAAETALFQQIHPEA